MERRLLKFIISIGFKWLLISQLIILSAVACISLLKARSPQKIDIDMETCVSDYASYENGEYYFDETMIDSGTWQDALTAGGISLPAGSYTLYIDYECLSDKMFAIYDGTVANSYLRADVGYLRAERQTEAFKFRTIVDIDSITLKVRYEPFGYLKIKNIYILSNIDNLKKLFTVLLVIFAAFDIVFIKRRTFFKDRNIVFGLASLIVLTSLPLFVPQLNNSLDLEFALLRIEGDYYELRHGIFPVKMVSLFLRGYGYPVSIFYGDVFLYIPAALRMLGFNVTEAWKAYIFINNLATVLGGYACFKKMRDNQYIAFMMTCAYSTAPFRLSNLYIRSAGGELTALTFYPLIALAFYKIYSETLTKEKMKKYSDFLALGMSALLCTHLLSTEMICFALLITAILAFIFRKRTADIYKTLAVSAMKTALLSAFFIVPFLDYYLTVPTQIKDTVSNETKVLQLAGAYPTEWFSLNPGGFTDSRFPSSPGIILMLCIPVAVYLWLNSRAGRALKITLIVSTLMLALSSAYFPWDFAAKYTHIGKLLAQVQFPVRYVGIALIFLVVLFGIILGYISSPQRMRMYAYATAAFAVIATSFFLDMYVKGRSITSYTNTSSLNTMNLVGNEYVLIGTDINNDLTMTIRDNNTNVFSIERDKRGIVIDYDSSLGTSDILVPLYNYKGYHVYDENGNEYAVRNGINNLITFTPPSDYRGKLYVKFREPLYWRLSEIVSLIYMLVLLLSYRKDILQLFSDAEKSREIPPDTGLLTD